MSDVIFAIALCGIFAVMAAVFFFAINDVVAKHPKLESLLYFGGALTSGFVVTLLANLVTYAMYGRHLPLWMVLFVELQIVFWFYVPKTNVPRTLGIWLSEKFGGRLPRLVLLSACPLLGSSTAFLVAVPVSRTLVSLAS